jgi:mannan endo-1,4-beta-mannosidase
MKAHGINNLRIMGASEGPDTEPWRVSPALQTAPGEYNEAVWEGLDFLLTEMAKREMYAVVCLNNFWSWSGGMSQYVSWANGNEKIPYHPPEEDGSWVVFQKYASDFYKNKKAVSYFENHIKTIVERVNTITGKAYKDDPTIMSWQLANEPRSFFNSRTFRRWIDKTSRFIKQLDQNHMVSLGSEGSTNTMFAGTNFRKDHRSKNIDYTTIHIWIQNWNWYDPKKPEKTFDDALRKATKYLKAHAKLARQMNKPLVLEEFGAARDMGSYDARASVEQRNQYFAAMFATLYELAKEGEAVAGSNFWLCCYVPVTG